MRSMTTKICGNCGIEFWVRISDVNRGRGRFCGKSCAAKGVSNSSYKHGQASRRGQSKEYRAWAEIKQRITNPKAENYKYYGGRGIEVCPQWVNSFEVFLNDVGRAPSPSHSIDRIDVNGDYSPENCRWATKAQQMSNMRSNKFLTYDDMTFTQAEWGRKTGLGSLIILKRLKRGWTIERALTTPRT